MPLSFYYGDNLFQCGFVVYFIFDFVLQVFTIETFNEKGTVLSLSVDSAYDVLSVGQFVAKLADSFDGIC